MAEDKHPRPPRIVAVPGALGLGAFHVFLTRVTAIVHGFYTLRFYDGAWRATSLRLSEAHIQGEQVVRKGTSETGR